MQDQLSALIKLAEIDSSARDIDDRIAAIPAEIEGRKSALSQLEQLVGSQRAKLEEAETLLHTHEKDLEERAHSLARAKMKGAKARNMKEADAAERELEGIRRSMRDAETERDRLKATIEKDPRHIGRAHVSVAEPKGRTRQSRVNRASAARCTPEGASPGGLGSRTMATQDRQEVPAHVRTAYAPRSFQRSSRQPRAPAPDAA